MVLLYKRKQQKEFYRSHASILWILHDLAFAAAHGHIDHDKLIRLGTKANGLVAKHGHLVTIHEGKGIPHGLWPAPRDGFPKPRCSPVYEEIYDIEILYEDSDRAQEIRKRLRDGSLKTMTDASGAGKVVSN